MTGDIRNYLAKRPFKPFTIHTADGRHIYVPTLDHITMVGARTQVTHDNGDRDILSGLLMAGLTIHESHDSGQERGS